MIFLYLYLHFNCYRHAALPVLPCQPCLRVEQDPILLRAAGSFVAAVLHLKIYVRDSTHLFSLSSVLYIDLPSLFRTFLVIILFNPKLFFITISILPVIGLSTVTHPLAIYPSFSSMSTSFYMDGLLFLDNLGLI